MADPRMVDRYLQSRGAAPSAANANRVREHFAANPDLLDRRAMGLPGGLDDNSGVLDGMLDKLIADTAAAPAAPNASMPETNGTQGDRNPAPAPSRRGPVATANPGASRQAGYGPGPSPSRQSGYSAPPPVDTSVDGTGAVGGAPADSGILKWLLPILGISAAVPAAENLRGQMSVAPPGALPPPQQRITSQVGPNVESVGQEMQTIDQRNQAGKTQQRAQVQQSVDAENDAMLRQMEEQARARRGQTRTKELTDAAKRATGRR